MTTNKKVDMANSADDTPEEQTSSGVIEYLSDLGINYEVCSCSKKDFFADSSNKTLYVRAVLLQDSFGPLLVIFLAKDILDYPNLCKILSRDLEWIEPEQSEFACYYNETVDSFPPLADIFGVKALIDDQIALQWHQADKIMFVTGETEQYISIATQDFMKIQESVWESNFSYTVNNTAHNQSKPLTDANLLTIEQSFCLRRMERRARETFELPVMPPMVDELLKLRVDPTAGAEDLARLVSQDPSLAAQTISWACSPYYGYPGKINSVEDAIIKVLGYELVMNISLGVAVGQIMRMPANGPLGLKVYWQHSIYAASLIEKIVDIMPFEVRPHKGLAYLCALLHNFGYLLLGQLFLPQFFILSQLVRINPQSSILLLENLLYQTNHQELGSFLMNAWHMPEELITSVSYHHDVEYDGDNSVYPNLIFMVNVLLSQQGMGDEFQQEIPERIFSSLKLDKQEVRRIFDEFWEERTALDDIIKLLAS